MAPKGSGTDPEVYFVFFYIHHWKTEISQLDVKPYL